MIRARSGFTLIEFLIVVAILAVLAGLAVIALSRSTRANVVSGAAAAIVSNLEDARSRTLASRNGAQYGVHIATGTVTIFAGAAYAPNDPANEQSAFDARAGIAASLAGGGSDIVFDRLTGETSDFGTITVFFASDPTYSATITVQRTGLATFE